MAMSLWDHEQRIRDLEHALVAALHALVTDDEGRRQAIREEAHRLRIDGNRGAADVLEGKLLRPSTR